jgi:hypothetical protein
LTRLVFLGEPGDADAANLVYVVLDRPEGGQVHRTTNPLDRELTRRHADGRNESRTLGSAAEVVAVLAEEFGLRLPPGADFPG